MMDCRHRGWWTASGYRRACTRPQPRARPTPVDTTSGAGERFNLSTHRRGVAPRILSLGGGERLHRGRAARRPHDQSEIRQRHPRPFRRL